MTVPGQTRKSVTATRTSGAGGRADIIRAKADIAPLRSFDTALGFLDFERLTQIFQFLRESSNRWSPPAGFELVTYGSMFTGLIRFSTFLVLT